MLIFCCSIINQKLDFSWELFLDIVRDIKKILGLVELHLSLVEPLFLLLKFECLIMNGDYCVLLFDYYGFFLLFTYKCLDRWGFNS